MRKHKESAEAKRTMMDAFGEFLHEELHNIHTKDKVTVSASIETLMELVRRDTFKTIDEVRQFLDDMKSPVGAKKIVDRFQGWLVHKGHGYVSENNDVHSHGNAPERGASGNGNETRADGGPVPSPQAKRD